MASSSSSSSSSKTKTNLATQLSSIESTITLENITTDPLYKEGMSMYEKLRIINIRRNEAALKAIGLDTNELTTIARGDKAPLNANKSSNGNKSKKKRRIPKVPTRFSTRLRNIPAVNYKELDDFDNNNTTNSSTKYYKNNNNKRQKKQSNNTTINQTEEQDDDDESIYVPSELPGKRRRKATKHFNPNDNGSSSSCSSITMTKSIGRQSIKELNVNLKYLDMNYLGKIIPPMGGQVKRAVMETSCTSGTPKFSRMSGIQKWKNCIQLFVNVYGNGYKNVFLNGGKQITWFAQSRQWEGTDVIQEMIHSAGSIIENEDGTISDEIDEGTPILLFCRNLGVGYVYCGRLSYMAHAPERIPIRFVWQLDDSETLIKHSKPFQDLVSACNEMIM